MTQGGTSLFQRWSSRAADEHFVRGGYVRANYHVSRRWREAYERVAAVSRRFVELAWPEGRGEYIWPLDPLHCWSRVWEYPFVADQLRRHAGEPRGQRLLDIGAAVTFFPFYTMRQGFEVTNLDFDPMMPSYFERAFQHAGGEMGVQSPPTYLTGDAREIRAPDGSFDVVTCISVLEHIPGWERAVAEVDRLLKPGGLFVLTFDVQHSGPADALSAADTLRLLQQIASTMDPLTTIEDVLPADALTPFNGPKHPGADRWERLRKLPPVVRWPRILANRMLRQREAAEPAFRHEDICVFAGVWRKRRAR